MTFAELLSEKITERVFDLGSCPTPCQRLEFKGGTYPHAETNQGGMDRNCLKSVVQKAIDGALKDLKP